MFKRVALLLVLVLAAAGVAVSASSDAEPASERTTATRMPVGFYDDEQVFGRTDWAFTQLKSLRAGIVRITIDWSAVARRRPTAPADPSDPAYNWTAVDNVVTQAAKNKIRVLAAIYGTPRWAGPGKSRLPRRVTDLRLFAFAAAKRYSGTFEIEGTDPVRVLPVVRHWLAWNEPNNPVFLFPQFIRTKKGVYLKQAAKNYAKICNAIVGGIHAAGRLSGEKIACGVTAPRGNNNPKSSRQSISPISFVRQMKRFGAKGFDAYAHHPYYGHRLETPTYKPRLNKGPKIVGGPVLLGNIDDLTREVTRLWGRKPIWITEYGYQTKPDRHLAVTYQQQAQYLREAFAIARKHPRIQMMLWFLLRDQAVTRAFDGWQGGLITKNGVRKPAFRSFQRVPK